MLRVERHEVRHVPMFRLGFIEVLQPFLQLTVLTNLKRRHMFKRGLGAGAEVVVDAKGGGCIDAGGEQRVDKDAIAGWAH